MFMICLLYAQTKATLPYHYSAVWQHEHREDFKSCLASTCSPLWKISFVPTSPWIVFSWGRRLLMAPALPSFYCHLNLLLFLLPDVLVLNNTFQELSRKLSLHYISPLSVFWMIYVKPKYASKLINRLCQSKHMQNQAFSNNCNNWNTTVLQAGYVHKYFFLN